MSGYIDVDAFTNEINERRSIQRYIRSYTADDILTALNNFHTADVKPIRGKWICASGSCAVCSKCNRLNEMYGNFCKHCGADMREESEEEE